MTKKSGGAVTDAKTIKGMTWVEDPTKTITIQSADDERMRFLGPDGEEIGYVNHDEHGWAGMDAAEKLVRATAAALGARVIEK